jgi:glutamyl endopeptidase
MKNNLSANGMYADTLESVEAFTTNETEFEVNLTEADLNTEVSSIVAELNGSFESAGFELVENEAQEEAAIDAIFGSYSKQELGITTKKTSDGENVAEVIIGVDNRVRVHATTVYPWRAICALKITARNGRKYIGTGWMVGPRTVITAGHCVYLHSEGGWASSIEVIPGRNDGSSPYGSASSGNLRSTTGWVNNRDRNFDYGAIILPENKKLGNTVGFFGIAVRPDAFLMASALNLSGYPGDKGGNQQWYMAQRPTNVSNTVITYNIDTFGGQSGAPVWVYQNGQRYCVGIHTNGSNGGNSATRINNSVYNNLLNWKNI